jgi:hypothetical protein
MFGSYVLSKYCKNALVSKNTMVLITLRCLALAKTAVLYTLFFDKLHRFCNIEKEVQN